MEEVHKVLRCLAVAQAGNWLLCVLFELKLAIAVGCFKLVVADYVWVKGGVSKAFPIRLMRKHRTSIRLLTPTRVIITIDSHHLLILLRALNFIQYLFHRLQPKIVELGQLLLFAINLLSLKALHGCELGLILESLIRWKMAVIEWTICWKLFHLMYDHAWILGCLRRKGVPGLSFEVLILICAHIGRLEWCWGHWWIHPHRILQIHCLIMKKHQWVSKYISLIFHKGALTAIDRPVIQAFVVDWESRSSRVNAHWHRFLSVATHEVNSVGVRSTWWLIVWNLWTKREVIHHKHLVGIVKAVAAEIQALRGLQWVILLMRLPRYFKVAIGQFSYFEAWVGLAKSDWYSISRWAFSGWVFLWDFLRSWFLAFLRWRHFKMNLNFKNL